MMEIDMISTQEVSNTLFNVQNMLANIEVTLQENLKESPSNARIKSQLREVNESQQILLSEQLELKHENSGESFDADLFEIERHQSPSGQGQVSLSYDNNEVITYFDPIEMDEKGTYKGKSDKYWEAVAKKLFYEGDKYNNIPPLKDEERVTFSF
jgi:hypothetical protein